jgi:hypothetical protein
VQEVKFDGYRVQLLELAAIAQRSLQEFAHSGQINRNLPTKDTTGIWVFVPAASSLLASVSDIFSAHASRVFL